METIQNWLENGSNYNEGVLLYAQLPGARRNLVRLFTLKQTAYNRDKLKQELEKHKTSAVKVKVTPVKATPVKRNIVIKIDGRPKAVSHNFKGVTLNMLPKELHQAFIDQKTRFLTNCALKIKLNGLRYNATAKALNLILEIDSNYAFIDLVWKQIDYYLENKVLLTLETQDYSALSPVQLFKAHHNKKNCLNSAKQRIKKYRRLIKTTSGRNLQNLKIKLGKSQRLSFTHQQNLLKIKEIIES